MIAGNTMQLKNLCNSKGFKSKQITVNSFMYFNMILFFFVAIPYWTLIEFYFDVFVIGLLGGISCTLANVFLNLALEHDGPAGPVMAISAMSSPELVVVISLVDWKHISLLELIACLFGMFGELLMTNHEFFEKYCFCCSIKS